MQDAPAAVLEEVGNAVLLDQTTNFLDLVRSGDRRRRRLVIIHHEYLVPVPDTIDA